MVKEPLEKLYRRFKTAGDIGALAAVFDSVAPDLLRLARKLVRQEDRAEDLVQETFLVAMQRPETFDDARPLLPWLVGVLVNRARTDRRRFEKRGESDRLTEREVATPEAEAHSVEEREAIETAVSELPANLRAVVEARLAGRDSAELATELGISRGALRVRWHRAVQKLRGLLPPSLATPLAILLIHSSALAKVRVQVLREAQRHAAARGLGALGATAGVGAFWMTKQSLIAAGLALTVTVFVGLRLALAEPEEGFAEANGIIERELGLPTEVSAVSSQEARLAADESSSMDNAVEMPREAAAVEVAATSTISGRVEDESGAAVGGARIEAWLGTTMKDEPSLTAESGADGSFTLEGLQGDFVVTASAEGLVCLRGLRGELAPDAHAQELVVAMTSPKTMRGLVVDPEGNPIPDASIRVFSGLNSTSDRDLTSVDGVLTFSAQRGTTRSDESGLFELAGLPRENHGLAVMADGFLGFQGQPNTEVDPPRIVLERGMTLGGRVIDANGNPAVGAKVKMYPYWGNIHTAKRTQITDEAGRFELTQMRRGDDDFGVMVVHEGHAVHVVQPVEPREEGGKDLTIALVEELRIAGRVVTEQGTPIPGATVEVFGPREIRTGATYGRPSTWEWHAGLDEIESDEDGAFLFDQLYAGTFEVQVTGPDGTIIDLKTAAGTEDLNIVVSPERSQRVTLTGTVVDDETGDPIPSFTVLPWIGNRATHGEFEDGRFELTNLVPGQIRVEVDALGYGKFSVREKFYAAGEHEFEVRMKRARTLEVRVLDENRDPIEQGRLQLRDSRGDRFMVPSAGGSVSHFQFHDGEATLRQLPAQLMTLVVTEGGGQPHEFVVDLRQEPTEPLVCVIRKQARCDLALLFLQDGVLPQQDVVVRMFENDERPESEELKQSLMENLDRLLVAKVELSLHDADGNLVGSGSIGPRPGDDEEWGTYLSSNTVYKGSSSAGSEGGAMLPTVSFRGLPAQEITVRIRREGAKDRTEVIDLTGGEDRRAAIVL